MLTAAHCVTDDFDRAVAGGIVFLGATDRSVFQSTQQRMSFGNAGIRVHPQYNSTSIRNDIATVRLDTAAIFNSSSRHRTMLPEDILKTNTEPMCHFTFYATRTVSRTI